MGNGYLTVWDIVMRRCLVAEGIPARAIEGQRAGVPTNRICVRYACSCEPTWETWCGGKVGVEVSDEGVAWMVLRQRLE